MRMLRHLKMRNFIEITGICIPILTKQYAHANGKCEKKACFAYRTSWDGQQSERDDHFSTYLVQLSIINKPNPMIFFLLISLRFFVASQIKAVFLLSNFFCSDDVVVHIFEAKQLLQNGGLKNFQVSKALVVAAYP